MRCSSTGTPQTVEPFSAVQLQLDSATHMLTLTSWGLRCLEAPDGSAPTGSGCRDAHIVQRIHTLRLRLRIIRLGVHRHPPQAAVGGPPKGEKLAVLPQVQSGRGEARHSAFEHAVLEACLMCC
jgi:hypothetical protein